MGFRGPLADFRSALPGASTMQIGNARVALLREIERETGQSLRPAPPVPRLTLVALALAGLACLALLLLIVGVVPRPH